MKAALLLIFLLNTASASQHPVYDIIVKLFPYNDRSEMMEFSNAVHKYSKKYRMDKWRSLSIVMQESGIRKVKPIKVISILPDASWEVVDGYYDLGYWQFNVYTILNYKMDPVKLKNDLDYATDWHFKILKEKLRRCKHLLEDAWTCYHSITKKLRLRYKKDVNYYYNQLFPSSSG